MKVSFVYKRDLESIKLKEHLIETLTYELDEENPDVVFTIGGDGTVLDAVRKHKHILDHVLFVTIHTGNLGFYTEFLPNQLDEIFHLLEKDNPSVKTYPLIAFSYDGEEEIALNELTLSDQHRVFNAEVYVDDLFLMHVRGNGLCVASPTGSTAYNKSLGGAVMDSDMNALQLTVIAPFQTAKSRMISPLVFSKHRTLMIKPQTKYLDISYDRMIISKENVKEVTIHLSDKKVRFLSNDALKFANRIFEKFIGEF